ncbi:MAG TPA: hypothetical protein VHN80_23665 [Kineosporiaceae bacterium]|nr:hypothetical protein [Kineosporiaceae bacterium]
MSRFELRWSDVDGAAPAVTSEARLHLAIEELHDHGGGEGRSERKEA